MDGITGDVTEYRGYGKCFVGVRRLSRKVDATLSPERQAQQITSATESVGGHIIGWADDWEVSGAVNPLDRPRRAAGAEAIAECARLDQQDDDNRTALAELLDAEARQAQAVDWEEIARQHEDDRAAAEALAVTESDEQGEADDETYALAA